MNKVNDVYKAILKYAGMEVDDKGFVSNVLGDRKEPSNINGKRIVIPYDNQLKNFNPDEKVVFHPLDENSLRGESEVIQKLKDFINIKLNYTIGIVGQQLLTLVASPELHSQLNTDQAELFVNVKECDAKSVQNFIMLMVSGAKSNSDRIFTNVYLKRGGTINEKRYSRVGVVSFPFYESLKEDTVDKIRKSDKETYKQLMTFMFPDIEEPFAYNYGTNNRTAPFLDCLMHTSAKIASRLNDIITEYSKWIEDGDKLLFSDEWLDYFADLSIYESEIRKIPMQLGNEGSISASENQPQPKQQAQPVFNEPASQYKAPVVVETERGLDFRSLMAANPGLGSNVQPQPMVPMYQPQYQQPPAFVLPPNMQPQPQYPQQYPQQYPPQYQNQSLQYPPQYPQQCPQQYQNQPQQYQQYPNQQPQFSGYAQNRLYG